MSGEAQIPDSDDVLREAGRLSALDRYAILDTAPEKGFDDVVKLAALLCGAPTALVTLVDGERQFFKAREGFDGPPDAPLDAGFCPIAVRTGAPLVVRDTLAEGHADNAAVSGGGVRFYAGMPLRTEAGAVLGTLCVLDREPRPGGLTDRQIEGLGRLADQVVGRLELRHALAERDGLLAEQRATIRERQAYARTQEAIAMSEGDLDLILDALVTGAMQAVPTADGGVMELLEGDELEYRSVRGSLAPHGGVRVPLDGSTSGACARTSAPILLADALTDSRVKADLRPLIALRSAVHAPVTRGGRVLGVLKLQSSEPDRFTARDLDLVRTFAGLATAGLTEASEVAAQRALAAGAQRQRAIFDSTTQFAILVTDLDGRITDWNTGAERILGWSAAEMLGRTVERIFTPEDRAGDRADVEMRLALENGRASNERWHLRRDGARFWASGEMMPLRDADGAHIGFVKVLRDRTEGHAAGAALREAEGRLRRAQEAGGVGLFTVHNADNVLVPSPAFCRLYGLPVRDSYPATAFEQLVIPEDAHLVSTADTRRRGEPPRDVEYRIRRPDTGELRWIARRGEIERDHEGRPVRFSGASRDVTERRLAGAALATSEARYRALFEAIDDGFCIIEFLDGPHGPSSDYIHVEANPGYARHTGIPGIVGRTVRDLAPAEADGWVELYGGVLRTGRPIRFERDFLAAGRHIEVSAARVEPASRRQVSVLFRDVTARKQAEAALRASEATARENVERVQLALAAGAIIGTWNWDLPSDRFTVDEPFARHFGLDPALGREGLSLAQVVETVHPDDQAGLAAAIDAVIARGGRYAHQYRVRRRDGRYYWLEANGHVEHGPDGTPLRFPGVLIDVEARRALADERDRALTGLRELNETLEQRVAERTAELMRAEEALRQSQKMEAVGQLTGGLAHDFNNLLAGIAGSLELMSTRLNQGRLKDIEKYMVAAQGAAKRAAALTHRLLAFSRRQTLDPKPTDVNRLVAGLTDLIRRTVGPGMSVETVGAAGLWPALVDPSQLENALLNLCINARDAMPDGGRITIETANKWLDRSAARTHDVPEGQYLSLCVTDTGTGMSPEVIAKAFDPFFTTKPIGEGTGLGLSMIYGFAQQSGGQVRIYSEVGQGTTVCIYLPRHYGAAQDEAAALAPTPAAFAQTGETVLVVDDEPSVRMLVADVLEDLGYTAIEAADSAAGLKVLQSNVRIDLLVTDVGLPGGMNGRQMADAGRERRPDLKVLFITGYAENAVLSNGHVAPGMSVLTKPFAIDTLAARIRELVTGTRGCATFRT